MTNKISKAILEEAKARIKIEAHQNLNAAIHAVLMEAGLDLMPIMQENAKTQKEETL